MNEGAFCNWLIFHCLVCNGTRCVCTPTLEVTSHGSCYQTDSSVLQSEQSPGLIESVIWKRKHAGLSAVGYVPFCSYPIQLCCSLIGFAVFGLERLQDSSDCFWECLVQIWYIDRNIYSGTVRYLRILRRRKCKINESDF